MEGNLFKKYEVRITKNKEKKKEIINYIEEATTILLDEKDIQIEGKNITIQTTSIKRSILTARNAKGLLREKGYILS